MLVGLPAVVGMWRDTLRRVALGSTGGAHTGNLPSAHASVAVRMWRMQWPTWLIKNVQHNNVRLH